MVLPFNDLSTLLFWDTLMLIGLDVLKHAGLLTVIPFFRRKPRFLERQEKPIVSRSSCESEYRAMANMAAEIIWINHLLRELNALPLDKPALLCDNRSALFVSQIRYLISGPNTST